MSEIKTEIKQNSDGSYTITDEHSTADIVRWLLTQDIKETILYLLGNAPQRTWVGLTDEEIDQGLLRSDYAFKTAEAWRAGVVFAMIKLKEKNT